MDRLDLQSRFLAQPSAEMLTEALVMQSFVDVGGIGQFWRQWYLQGFVDCGVGKLKFVRGRPGSGKTHLLRHLAVVAREDDYVVVRIDARATRLMAVDELYRAIASQVPWEELVDRCALNVIREALGYHDFALAVPEFSRWAVETHGRSSSILAADVRDETDRWIRGLDVHAAWVHPIRNLIRQRIAGESGNDEPAYRWLQGQRLSASERRAVGVPANVDRRSARSMLLSLAVLIHAASHRGLMVLVDNAEVMARVVRTEGVAYYTRASRDQAYEMVRELIDESHQSAYLFLVVAGSSDLYENQKTGFPSYPALWARIQSEIVTVQLNRFADLMDLDSLWRQHRDDQTRLLETWRTIGSNVQLDPTTQMSEGAAVVELESIRRTVARALTETAGGMNHDV